MAADLYTISAGITTAISGISFVGTLYFNSVAKREDRSLSQIIGGEPVSAEDIRSIIKEFKDDASRLKALELLLGDRGDHAGALYTKIRENIDVNKLARSQAQHNYSLSRVTTVAVLVLSVFLWAVGIQGAGRGKDRQTASNGNENNSTTSNPPPNQGVAVTADFMDPKWATARGNIDWVWADEGAQRNYLAHRGQGNYQAILIAQRHNKGAYESISQYGPARTDRYCKSKGFL